MNQLSKKLSDTLEVFQDLQNLYVYKEATSGILKTMYDNTMDILNKPNINVINLLDEKDNNLLHLAADAYNVNFFLLVASQGINPYLKNKNNRNAFQSKHYDFANIIWKKFEHINFDNQIINKSFKHITQGFHSSFKQAIYESNIGNNSSHYDIDQLIDFLNENNIYSHHNVLLFSLEKYNGNIHHLLSFITKNFNTMTPEDNSLAIHCCLKTITINHKKQDHSLLFDQFINHSVFSLDSHFFQSMKYSAQHYKKTFFQNIFHKQTKILVQNQYNIKQSFNFYFFIPLKNQSANISSIEKLSELYQLFSLQPVWDYYHVQHKLLSPKSIDISQPIKKIKI